MPDALCVQLSLVLAMVVVMMSSHLKSKRHKEALPSNTPINSLFQPQRSNQAIEAKVRWATFVAKHNISFLSSDHAIKLFNKMFLASEIAKEVLLFLHQNHCHNEESS